MPDKEWIPVTGGDALDRDPLWSLNNNLLYWLTDRDGFRCIAAQRLDPATRKPLGDMLYVQHFHSAARSMPTLTK